MTRSAPRGIGSRVKFNTLFGSLSHNSTPGIFFGGALLILSFLASPVLAQAVDPTRWMTELAEEAADAGLPSSALDQTLAEFIFPGTHVSGSYGIPDWDIFDPFNAPPLACDKCGFYEESGTEVSRLERDEQQAIKVIDERAEKMSTLPTISIECPKCKNNKAGWWFIQTRSGDEPATQFYRCTKCTHTWRSYS